MFSVIIPAYNSENTIEKALDSLRNQTKPELIREVIVINDGSADATADKVEQYKKRESCNLNIILYNQQNAGVAAARNAGPALWRAGRRTFKNFSAKRLFVTSVIAERILHKERYIYLNRCDTQGKSKRCRIF